MFPGSQNHIIFLKPALIGSCDYSGSACTFAAPAVHAAFVVNVHSCGEQVLTYCSLDFVRPLYLRQYTVIWGNVFFIFSYLILFHFVAFYIREEILLERLMWAIIKSKKNKNLLRLKNINSDLEL